MDNKSEIKGTFSFVSLGCPKNLVDSERMLGLLAQDGYVLVPEATKSDLVIINTCGFIDAARQESLTTIREMIERKTIERDPPATVKLRPHPRPLPRTLGRADTAALIEAIDREDLRGKRDRAMLELA